MYRARRASSSDWLTVVFSSFRILISMTETKIRATASATQTRPRNMTRSIRSRSPPSHSGPVSLHGPVGRTTSRM